MPTMRLLPELFGFLLTLEAAGKLKRDRLRGHGSGRAVSWSTFEVRCGCKPHPFRLYFSSTAFIVILALRTLETGHPALAFSAAF